MVELVGLAGPDAVAQAKNPPARVLTVDLALPYLRAPGDERVWGFLGVDGTLNSKYRRCEIHVAVGVEHYIHVPQVTPASGVP